ncbi:MAG: recombinase family protein [Cyanobacteria bacterium]|nr:recombinase family protein [Cyanobacteriota bacterium]
MCRLCPRLNPVGSPRTARAVLGAAGCSVVFAEKVSSTVPSHKRAALQKALGAVAPGDTLVVSKLDRLGRTQSEVVARLDILQEQEVFVKIWTVCWTPLHSARWPTWSWDC